LIALYTIGFGGSNHDYSVCLVKDGEILFAIEEERITRKKYGYGINVKENKALNYVLKAADITENNISYFGANDILDRDYLCVCKKDIIQYNHHVTHAASAYYPSGFQEAAILVIDHSGSHYDKNGKLFTETVSYYQGENRRLDCLQKVEGQSCKTGNIVKRPTNSIGYFYSMIAKMLGCVSTCSDGKVHSESGKLMGLSSYGEPIYFSTMSDFTFVKDGIVQINIECIENFVQHTLQVDRSDKTVKNLAASAQHLLEDMVVKCAKHLYSITGCDNICIAGGVGLNGLANMAILKNTMFKNIFIQPAANDAGTSIGAALLAYHENNTNSPYSVKPMKNNFYGVTYSDENIEKELSRRGGIYWKKDANSSKIAAELIANDNIIAWFQGGSEFGPRSLGNRSILANPTNKDMKDILNSRVKFRESYRPYAPSVMGEYKQEYFELEHDTNYMLLIPEATTKAQQEIPAVVHIDNTARVQTVSKEFNPKFYKVIEEFYRIKNTPILLNTSMNVMGEPICETPEDAVRCLMKTNIDYLFIGDYIVGKQASD
jgi:carbamoyltransferase